MGLLWRGRGGVGGGETSSLWGKEGRWLTGWKGQYKIASGKEVRGWARVLGRCIISVWSFRISRATGVQMPPGGQREPQAHHLRINNIFFFFFSPAWWLISGPWGVWGRSQGRLWG